MDSNEQGNEWVTVTELCDFLSYQRDAGRGEEPVYLVVPGDYSEQLKPIRTIRLCESYTALDTDSLTKPEV